MKRNKSLKIIFVLSIFLNFINYSGCLKNDVTPPERIEGIPQDAVWHGGIDGGHWYKFIEKTDSITFRFQLFDDVTGKLIQEGKFKAKGDCLDTIAKMQNIQVNINYWDGSGIVLSLPNNKNCYLEKIK
jgi:hypothetical protein